MTEAAIQTLYETTAMVPLADLYIHPFNTRTEPPPADIEALAESIADLGLLQNLAGFADHQIRFRPDFAEANPAHVGIVAGGRRLRALLHLAAASRQNLAKTTVPVRITNDQETARLWASAENTARQALHPADEIRAYGRMAAQGADPNRIARAFAVTERHVRQRLKLATLPDPALAALRDGSITLDQAAALTAARQEEALLAELQRVKSSHWTVSASEIRQRLQGNAVRGDDRRVVWLGLETYVNAGGQLLTDLFTDQTRLLDEGLLDQLFEDRLAEAAAEEQRTGGWKWVIPRSQPTSDHDAEWKLERIERVPVDLPDADAAELEELSERAEHNELTDEELARMEELETRAEGDFSEADRATSGRWIFVDHQGRLRMSDPRRKPEDDPNHDVVPEGDDSAAGAAESPALSNSLLTDLKAIRLAGLQLKAGESPELMLDLLAWQLSGELRPYSSVLLISTTPATITPEKPEGTSLPARLTDVNKLDGKAAPDATGFAAFRALGKKHRNEVIARALARLIPTNELAPALAAQLRPALREIWTPTKSGYLTRLPMPALDQIWCELVPDDRSPDHAAFRAMKKADKANLLHQLFEGHDLRETLGLSRDQNARIDAWLPAELHWPAIDAEGEE